LAIARPHKTTATMTMNVSRDFLFIFMFIMPMLCSSSEVDFQLDPLQLSKEDVKLDDLDPLQLSEEDAQLDPLKLSEEDVQLDPLKLSEQEDAQLDDAEITRSWQLSEGDGDYGESAYGKKTCPSGYDNILEEAECKKAQQATKKRWAGAHSWGHIQGGCFTHRNKHVWFNKNLNGRSHGAFASVCISAGGCPGGWPQIKDVEGGGNASSAVTAKSGGDCAAKCTALATCGSFKFNDLAECSFNTWAQSTTEETAVEGAAVTCKKVFTETAYGATACPSDMKYEVTDEKTCKDAGAALGKKWGGASSWNNIPGGCSSRSAGGSFFNLESGIAKKDFAKLCTSSPPKGGAPAPAPEQTTTVTTTPSLTSVCTPGVCTKGKWALYLSGTTEVECKAKCEESRRYVSVAGADGIQEDVYSFRQNGRFHDVTSKMSSASRMVTNINYPGTGGYWKDPSGKDWTIRDHFYGRWTGYIEIKAAGKYTFNTRSDDGSRLSIDDKQIVDNAGWHGMRDKRGSVELTAGKHNFSAEMFEGGGGAGMEWKYNGPDTGNKEIIVPGKVLSSSLAGSSVKEFNKEYEALGMCKAYSHNGDECVIYSSCTELGADKESLVCEDNSFDWVEPSTLTTCKY